jgi:glycogen operon protein
MDWDGADEELLDFTRQVIALRRDEPVFARRKFFSGKAQNGSGLADVVWLRPDGQAMEDGDWGNGHHKSLAVFLNGREVEPAPDGSPQRSDSFLVLLNAHHEGVDFTLDPELGASWRVELATDGEHHEHEGGATTTLTGRAMRVLRRNA